MVEIMAVRSQTPLITVELYCEAEDCSAREIKVRIKDYDSTLHKANLRCPLCGSVPKLHYAIDRETDRKRYERACREGVAVQMYKREHGACVPFSVLGDDRLPPTPGGWFDKVRS
jgi:hypothetical protein